MPAAAIVSDRAGGWRGWGVEFRKPQSAQRTQRIRWKWVRRRRAGPGVWLAAWARRLRTTECLMTRWGDPTEHEKGPFSRETRRSRRNQIEMGPGTVGWFGRLACGVGTKRWKRGRTRSVSKGKVLASVLGPGGWYAAWGRRDRTIRPDTAGARRLDVADAARGSTTAGAFGRLKTAPVFGAGDGERPWGPGLLERVFILPGDGFRRRGCGSLTGCGVAKEIPRRNPLSRPASGSMLVWYAKT